MRAFAQAPTATPQTKSALPAPSGRARPGRGGQGLGRVPALPAPPLTLQARLAVGAPGDHHEREADRVSEQVMRMPAPQPPSAPAGGSVEHRAEHLQLESVRAGGTGRVAAPPIVHEVLRSPGEPLDAATRGFMEPRFGHDFGRVRVHTGARAAEAAREVGALAFTVGRDLVFDAGRYAPATAAGGRLLAHELTHVMQQSGGGGSATARAEAPYPRVSVGAGGIIQREARPSHQLAELARTAIDELDDRQSKKVLLSTILAAARLAELPAFVAILKAKPHDELGDYFIFLISEMEEDYGSRVTVGLLKLFADAGVDVTKQLPTYSLQPLAAVAKFKSYVQRYEAVIRSGKVPEAEKRRVDELIREAEAAIRGVEGPRRKPGSRVQMAGGAAVAAGVLWRASAALAADDVTGIGVADDVAIPFVVVGAVILSAIALFSGGPKPEILDYGPAKAKVNAALLAMAAAVDVAVNGPRPVPLPLPQERTEPPTNTAPRKAPEPSKTVDPVPVTPLEPDEKRRRRRRCRDQKDPCGTPLPIRWPGILPLPSDRRPLVRTPSGDPYIEPERRSRPQQELQRAINEARRRGVPPPRPCFRDDAEPNAPYDAHHIQPLYLGGAEDQINLCSLRADYHQRGHPVLNDQRDMLDDPIWIACKICNGNLPSHPALQEYYIAGRK